MLLYDAEQYIKERWELFDQPGRPADPEGCEPSWTSMEANLPL
jgi:hypothetical protein